MFIEISSALRAHVILLSFCGRKRGQLALRKGHSNGRSEGRKWGSTGRPRLLNWNRAAAKSFALDQRRAHKKLADLGQPASKQEHECLPLMTTVVADLGLSFDRRRSLGKQSDGHRCHEWSSQAFRQECTSTHKHFTPQRIKIFNKVRSYRPRKYRRLILVSTSRRVPFSFANSDSLTTADIALLILLVFIRIHVIESIISMSVNFLMRGNQQLASSNVTLHTNQIAWLQ